MAGRIRREDIDELRGHADIADLVGDYTALKRAGTRLKGLCPFHQEKTPSFTVDPAQGMYYCFGCGKGGDLYGFLMDVEGFDFTEAVEHVARRSGYTLHYEELSAGQRRRLGERSGLVELNELALAYYRKQLYAEAGAPARDYLKARGFGREDADRFELGFAPEGWDGLSRTLQAEGHDQRDLIKVGLAVQNDRGGLRDRFRGRLLFPIRDAGGDLIGFGGRVLPGIDYGDFDPPKYLNTAETPLYRKHEVLYALPQARAEIVRSARALVCEGYTDVMALHQAGAANAVATCGTAVGEDHMRVLSRYTQQVVLAFDADAAGTKAALRAWEISRPFELDVRVLVLPPGRDPADLVREGGVDAVHEALDGAERIVPFVLRRTLEEHDLTSEEGRSTALKAAVELLGHVDDPDLRRSYARSEVADPLGFSIEFVEATAARAGVTFDRHGGIDVGARAVVSRGPVATVTRERAQLERDVLRLALQHPDLLPEEWSELEADDLTHPRAREVFAAIVAAGGVDAGTAAVVDAAVDDEVRGLVRAIALEDEMVEPDAEHAAVLVGRLLLPRLDRRIAEERAELERRNPAADPDDFRRRFAALAELEARRRALANRRD